MDCRCLIAFFCFIFAAFHGTASEGDQLVENFDVKPGGVVHSYEKQHGTFKCEFVYAAQGGTNENWEMTIEADGQMYSCTVARPQGTSYLFFQHFKMSLTGAALEYAEAASNNDRALNKEEFIIDKAQNEVRSSADHFQSQMARLTVFAVAPRAEL